MNLTDKEKKEFIDIVNSKVELEKLHEYLFNNQELINSLCIEQSKEIPFNADYYSTALLINIIEGFKNGKITKNDTL
jgi:hypothetical protein